MQTETTAESFIRRIDVADMRTLDAIAAKAYFYLALVYERAGKLDALRR